MTHVPFLVISLNCFKDCYKGDLWIKRKKAGKSWECDSLISLSSESRANERESLVWTQPFLPDPMKTVCEGFCTKKPHLYLQFSFVTPLHRSNWKYWVFYSCSRMVNLGSRKLWDEGESFDQITMVFQYIKCDITSQRDGEVGGKSNFFSPWLDNFIHINSIKINQEGLEYLFCSFIAYYRSEDSTCCKQKSKTIGEFHLQGVLNHFSIHFCPNKKEGRKSKETEDGLYAAWLSYDYVIFQLWSFWPWLKTPSWKSSSICEEYNTFLVLRCIKSWP